MFNALKEMENSPERFIVTTDLRQEPFLKFLDATTQLMVANNAVVAVVSPAPADSSAIADSDSRGIERLAVTPNSRFDSGGYPGKR